MSNTILGLVLLGSALATLACGQDAPRHLTDPQPIAPPPAFPPEPPAVDPAAIAFIPRFEQRLPARPQGIAITPDGRNVVVTSFETGLVQLREAEGYTLLREEGIFNVRGPWGLAISHDGRIALGSSRPGILTAFSLSGLETLYQLSIRTRMLIRSGRVFFGSGHVSGQSVVFQLTADGTIVAQYPIGNGDNNRFTLSIDDRLVLAVDALKRLHVLDARTLAPERVLPLVVNFSIWLVIPLRAPNKVLLLGGDENGPAGSVVDYVTGDVAPTQLLAADPKYPWLEYGYGNPWVSIGNDITVVTTRQGFILVNERTGRLERLEINVPTLDEANWCCEVAYDLHRDRLLVVNERFESFTHIFYGRLIAYDIVRNGR
ncbi:MAG: YncE family protein [Gemmatimonadota bacterium]